ncbi:hypothetical protein B0A48_07213 [Cryoendolithus antarcticus]|uniref:Uncharacterized protein n=1 Tax=Cryoendolithus antarcticus TaxID=1507870 RepID=A0A1V8T7X1_9PEZI|nr:hypothetical protein B0A48_07213 [Cryoendolithus antarcticus]
MASVQGCHIVGSVPLADTESVLRACATGLPDRLKRMPDGETGTRWYFVNWQQSTLPEYVQVKFGGGGQDVSYPLTAQEVEDARLRLETAGPLETGYDTAAIDSYHVFAKLKNEGVIPKLTKFQVCIPTAANVIGIFVRPELRAATEPLYEAALYRAIRKIQDTVPHGELAIQIDLAVDTAFWEGVVWEPYFGEGDQDAVKEVIVQYAARMIAQIDSDVEVGIHNCYGDIVPKLKQHGTDLYLGVVHHGHASATKEMVEAAGKVLDGYLVAEQAFSEIKIFEQRSTVGGIWNYVPCTEGTAARVAHRCSDVEKVEGRRGDTSADRPFGNTSVEYVEPLTPLYDRLETNIPRDLMGFSDLDWPEDCQLFPRHETVLEYIEKYAEDVRHLISFRAQVLSVHSEGEEWHVDVSVPQISGSQMVEHHKFDAVVVASGHFDVPYMPDVTGMENWVQAYPGSILHSKYYRTPDQYADKKVIVVGNSASGTDIGAQIRTVCRAPLIASTRSASYLQAEAPPGQVDKPAISEFVVADKTVVFADGSREQHVDAVLYCTGYYYSFPFLQGLSPPVVNTGERVERLYQHLFYWPNPTLIFPTLNQKIIPFPFAEAQAAVVARALAGRLSLPSSPDMKRWEDSTVTEMGARRDFHVLKFPKDAAYINMMHDWAMRAQGNAAQSCGGTDKVVSPPMAANSPLAGDHQSATGKEPPYWTEREYWMRERFPAIKKAFQDFGEARHSKRTLADVGFVFNG